jgi:hypothetical protein
MKFPSRVVMGAVLGAWVLGACDDGDGGGGLLGGGGSGGTCSVFTPCGGSVVGTWDVKEFCATGSMALEIPNCPTASAVVENFTATGSVTYNANLTSSGNVAFTGVMKATVPMSCLNGQTCAQLESAFKAELTDPNTDFTSAACTGSTACVCMLGLKSMQVAEPGTYLTSGNNLTHRDAANEEDNYEYCASATELRMRTPMSAGMMGLVANIRLTKR